MNFFFKKLLMSLLIPFNYIKIFFKNRFFPIQKTLLFNGKRNKIYIIEYNNKKYIWKNYTEKQMYDIEKNILEHIIGENFCNYAFDLKINNNIGLCFKYDPDVICLLDYEHNDIDIFIIFKNLIESVHLLHKKGIVHRDIKPENFLIRKSDLKIFIIDYEFSMIINDEKIIVPKCGTVGYVSPNLLNDYKKNYYISYQDLINYDIFALGICLHVILSKNTYYKYSEDQSIYMSNNFKNNKNYDFVYKNENKLLTDTIEILTNEDMINSKILDDILRKYDIDPIL
jgi:serine/threonine protein kinase